MDIEAIEHETMPKALGPYSQVIRAGDLLFVSGQAGIDPVHRGAPQPVGSKPRRGRRS